jgi:hypothetical protein
MKKICLTLIILLSVIQFSNAQWTTSGTNIYNSNTGFVGIGNTNPTYNLDVTGMFRATGNITVPSVNNQYIGYGSSNNTFSFAAGANVLSGSNNTGTFNTALGNNVMNADNLSGTLNVAIGYSALNSLTTGSYNLAIGTSALENDQTGGNNVAIGIGALSEGTTNRHSVGVGTNALTSANADMNTAIGYSAGESVITGTGNTFIGFFSGAGIQGSNNTILGSNTSQNPFSGLTTGSNNTIIGSNFTGLSPTLSNYVILGDGSGNQRLTIDNNGNAGIGTTTANSKLQVSGGLITGGSNSNGNLDPAGPNGNLGYLSNTGDMLIGWNRLGGTGETDFVANPGAGTTGGFAFYNHPNTGPETQLMFITGTGNVLINRITQNNTTYKLDVNGNARANEIVVNTDGADFVFNHSYKLPSLSTLKKYIDRNHHLPEIISAKQMQAEGLNVGENQTKLLQKVEELTLYLIEKDKQVSEQSSQLKSQQSQIDKLNRQLEHITNMLDKN